MDTHLSWLKYLELILKYKYLGLQLTLEYLVSLWSLIQYQHVFYTKVCEPTEKCIKQTVEGCVRSGEICFKKAVVKVWFRTKELVTHYSS